MKIQKGFTLIELMVVIVIIGILSALAIPKMFGVSAKAKAAEAPGAIANWETLQSAYNQETATYGIMSAIGFVNPTAASKWFDYTENVAGNVLTATVRAARTFGTCVAGSTMTSTYTVAAGVETIAHGPGAVASAPCRIYVPNF